MSEQNWIPNQWRVLTLEPEPGEQPDTFYVLRNPPNPAFATDDRGNRREFASSGAAQAVADALNARGAQ